MKTLGKVILKALISIIQIPLTVVYFALAFFGSVISGLGWLFGVLVFGAAICFWIFGEFDSNVQLIVTFGIATALVILPGWITDFLGEGILLVKEKLSKL
jgi:hypothetical protein